MRKAIIKRKTNEVDIKGDFCIDGKGKYKINTGSDFLNHLFTVFSFHGLFDFTLESKGDLKHHLFEDIGISLGGAFKKALGDGKGIKRYGWCVVPMDNSCAQVSVDISGRPYLQFTAIPAGAVDNFSFDDAKEFLEAFVQHAKITLHIDYKNTGTEDLHHTLEAIFKALGIALDCATQIDPRRKGIPSTKGVID